MLVVLLLLDVCSRFEIASPTGYKKGTQKIIFITDLFLVRCSMNLDVIKRIRFGRFSVCDSQTYSLVRIESE